MVYDTGMARKTEVKPQPPTQLTQAAARRPSRKNMIPPDVIDSMARLINELKIKAEQYAVRLRPGDRQRLNKVGIKKQGFIQRVYANMRVNPEYLPHYLSAEWFGEASEYFNKVRSLCDGVSQIRELLVNIDALAADAAYTCALEYYAAVREAAKRGFDGAQTVHKDLEGIFKRIKSDNGKQTKKKTMRNAKALIEGKRDGKIVIENIKPKLAGGKHKVVVERFDDDARFRETGEGEKNL